MNYSYHFINDNTVVERESTFFIYISLLKLTTLANCSSAIMNIVTDHERKMAAIRIKNWLKENYPELFI